MSKQSSTFLLILTVIYCWVMFLFMGVVVLVIINLWEGNSFYLSEKQLKATFVLSGIAGCGAGLRSWIFAKIDERNAKKSPPSDPKS